MYQKKGKKGLRARVIAILLTGIMSFTGIPTGSQNAYAAEKQKKMTVSYDMTVADGLLKDQSGNGNDAVLVNMKEADVQVGANGEKSLKFNGNRSSYVKLPRGILPAGNEESFSVEVKFNTKQKAFAWVFNLGTKDSGNADNYVALNPIRADGNFAFLVKKGVEKGIFQEDAVEAGSDTTVTMVFDGAKALVYLNGAFFQEVQHGYKIAELLQEGVDEGTDYIGCLGHSLWQADPGYEGTISTFNMYNYALTAEEVAAVYKIAEDKAELGIEEVALSDLELPEIGKNGSVITWVSSDESTISSSGKLGDFEGNRQVTLQASIKQPELDYSVTKKFQVLAVGDGAAGVFRYQAEQFDLGVTYTADDIVLPESFQGISIKWSSDHAALTNQGKITRGNKDTSVRLIAEFSKDGQSMKREFEVVVAAKPYGYLATYVAQYEPDFGAEFAQFPSKEYTNTYRTDVLYYGLSKDGGTYTALNNNKPVMYPVKYYQLGSPRLFRKGDGTYGLIASVDNDSDEILVYDTKDMIFYENQRLVKINKDGIKVKNPSAVYDNGTHSYKIYWEGGDGKSYVSVTEDFSVFSNPEETDYSREIFKGTIPDYAVKEEAARFELTKEEYDRVEKKFGEIHSVSVEGIDEQRVKPGQAVSLPDTVNVVYNDGSKAQMGVEWNTEGLDLEHLEEGEYTVSGTINATTEYESPLASFRADPYAVYDEEKDKYYFTGSNLNEYSASGGTAYESLVIRVSDTINGINTATEYEIWKEGWSADNKVRISGWYWAPEIHKIGGKWRIIALATVQENKDKGNETGWRQCIFTCNGEDMTKAENWEFTGYVHETTDGQWIGAFDTTYCEINGKSYYVTPRDAKIWITTVDPEDPLHPTGPLVCLSTSDRAFEANIGSGKDHIINDKNAHGQEIEEASAVLIHGDKVFIAYAGCTVDMMYCVGLLYADINSNLMDANSWKKYPYPILNTTDLTTTVKQAAYAEVDNSTGSGLKEGNEGIYKGTFGPGHNTFTVDENGNPVIIYHARDWDDSYPGATGDAKYGLVDPGRHAYARSVHFDADGFPICNMSPDQILSPALKNVTMTIRVSKDAGRIDLNNANVKAIPAQTYTGEKVTPSVAVTYNGKTLKKGTDYSVSYSNNVKIGTATVKITGKGNYTGRVTKNFTITVKKNKTYTVGNYKYKITNANIKGKGTVTLTGVKSKAVKNKLKKINVPATVKIGGKSFQVTAIGASAFSGCKKAASVVIGGNVTQVGSKAFYNCKSLKKLTVKSKKLKSVGKNALKNIRAKAVIKVPKSKLKNYKKLLKGKGQKGTVKITK